MSPLSTKKHFKIFRIFLSIFLCLLLIFSGLFLSPQPVQAWSNTGGGDHGGADWTPANGTYIAGNHTNIGTFTVAGGTTVYIQPYDGTSYGSVQINANTIDIQGTLTASGQGYGGGGAGGGGAGRGGREYTSPGGSGGSGTAGGANGQNGTGDPYTGGTQYCSGLPGGSGGSGGGTYGGSGGSGGAGTPEGSPYPNCNKGLSGNSGSAGNKGGYNTSQGQGDFTTDESLRMGSGGGGSGGGGGSSLSTASGCGGGGGGGGAGNRGGGYIKLYAASSITISGNIYAKGKDNSAGNGATGGNAYASYHGGDGGNGGGAASSGGSNGGSGGASYAPTIYGGTGGEGGYGAGGGILLKSGNVEWGIDIDGTTDNRGGGNSTANGGTIKIFYPEGADLTSTHYEGRYYTSQLPGDTKPKAATGQGASVVSYNQVDLSWTDESGIEDGYRIYRQVEGGGYSLLATTTAGSTSYSDTSTYNKSYQYYVVAYNGTAESDQATTTTVYTPCANADVQENQARPTQQWYQEGDFIFSSSNLDNDYIEYYRYRWDRNPTATVTTSDSQWMTGTSTLTRPPYNSKKNYFHVLGYNLNNEAASQGTQHYGPYYFVETYRLLRGGKFFDDDGVLIEMGPKE